MVCAHKWEKYITGEQGSCNDCGLVNDRTFKSMDSQVRRRQWMYMM